jgi:hypothetical protein
MNNRTLPVPLDSMLQPNPSRWTVPPPQPLPHQGRGWTAGRIVATVLSSVVLLFSFGLMAVGGTLLVAADVVRGSDGYYTTAPVELETPGYALVTSNLEIRNDSGIIGLPERVLGTIRIEASADGADVFVGIADSDDVATYLRGVGRSTVVDPLDENGDPAYVYVEGVSPRVPPGEADIWKVSAAGAGTQTVRFAPAEGDWTLVVMRADGTASVRSSVSVGATLPLLNDFGFCLLAGGLVLFAAGSVGLWLALRRD